MLAFALGKKHKLFSLIKDLPRNSEEIACDWN